MAEFTFNSVVVCGYERKGLILSSIVGLRGNCSLWVIGRLIRKYLGLIGYRMERFRFSRLELGDNFIVIHK